MEPQNPPLMPTSSPIQPGAQNIPSFINTSGQGKASVVPEEIKGWSWGAFGFNWIWGICNGTYIALLMFIPFVNIVMPFILGVKGKEWAWRNKHWDSVERFKKVQRMWGRVWWLIMGTLAGLAILGIIVLLILQSLNAGQKETMTEVTTSAPTGITDNTPSETSSSTNQMGTWKTYTNTTNGYTFQYPASWSLNLTGDTVVDQDITNLTSYPQDAYDAEILSNQNNQSVVQQYVQDNPMVGLYAESFAAGPKYTDVNSFEQLVNQTTLGPKKSDTIVSQATTTLDGISAIKLTTETASDFSSIPGFTSATEPKVYIYIFYNSHGYLIDYYSYPQQQIPDVINFILSTFTFIKGDTEAAHSELQGPAYTVQEQLLQARSDASTYYTDNYGNNGYGSVGTDNDIAGKNCGTSAGPANSALFSDTTSGMKSLIDSIVSAVGSGNLDCGVSSNAWSIAAILPTGDYFCVDSTGAAENTTLSNVSYIGLVNGSTAAHATPGAAVCN